MASPIYVALLKAISKLRPSGRVFLTSTIFFLISLDNSTVEAPLLA